MFDYQLLFPWLKTKKRFGGNDFTVLPEDTFLVSYPRSGNTWVRFLLATLYSGEPQTFRSIEKIFPDPWQNSDEEMLAVPRPRIIKSHESFREDFKKVVYIVRDPRDVAISFYYWRRRKKFFRKRGLNVSLEAYLHQFLEQEIAFEMSWKQHTDSWLKAREKFYDDSTFLLVKYRDLLRGPKLQLERVSNFLGWEKTKKEIAQAVKYSSIDEMRKSDVQAKSTETQFVRAAKKEQWREVFTPELKRLYKNTYKDHLRQFNFPLN